MSLCFTRKREAFDCPPKQGLNFFLSFLYVLLLQSAAAAWMISITILNEYV